MKTLITKITHVALAGCVLLIGFRSSAQTNVLDDVIATTGIHGHLKLAIEKAELDGALRDNSANYTVFAPTDQAFEDLATALGTNIQGILDRADLADILLYHVLAVKVSANEVTNGATPTPLNDANTIKLTKTSGGSVYANQAMVNIPDNNADNGVVHSIDAVLLPFTTVVDIALADQDNFSILTTAVITAELLPALTNPLATLTVFAPTNDAFASALAALDISASELLASPNLANILTYHVLGARVAAAQVTNGATPTPLNTDNTIKLTKTSGGSVFANQAKVIQADVNSDNGVVHVIDAVILPNETVVDVALDNDFTTLATAVITAELLPALTNPFTKFTVFAPTNEAFENLAVALETDIDGILALSFLSDVLLYHVVSGEVLSTDLVNGPVATLNGQSLTVDLTSGVKIDDANVILANQTSENGVVHVIDAVILPNLLSINSLNKTSISVYPNPSSDVINFSTSINGKFTISSIYGSIVKEGNLKNGKINITDISNGTYIVTVNNGNQLYHAKFIKE
jgi:transforming growth factor-beta-induced protein